MSKTKLRIHTWPEKILRKKLKKVEKVTDEIRLLLDDMVSFMFCHKGIGLAANQVGIDSRLVVIDHEGRTIKLINPEIIKREKKLKFSEGCLSFPGLEVDVTRSERVWVKALNERGEEVTYNAKGLLSIIFQHEIDHINGITFIDKISLFQRIRINKTLKNIECKTKEVLRDERNEK